MASVLVSKITAASNLSALELLTTKGMVYTFLNPVSYLDAMEHKYLFSQFDGIFADGSLLVGSIKLLYNKSVPRRSCDATSLATEVFGYAEENGSSIYVVASKQEEGERALKILHKRYPAVKFAGYRNGFFDSEEDVSKEIQNIIRIAPDFLIVGMGAIKQERFLLKVKEAGFQGIGFTCGGFIHQTSKDDVDYYPVWVDKMNVRFLYRAYKEPHTRNRYLRALFLFPLRFTWERLTSQG